MYNKMPEIGVQTNPNRKHPQYKMGFEKGRKAGIWLSYNTIFPIPVEILSKDMAREGARRLGMPGYSNKSIGQLKDFIVSKNINSLGFKPNNQKTDIELVEK